MNRIPRVAFAGVMVLAVTAAFVHASAAEKPIMMAADQLKWTPNPTAPGVSTAVVWGNPEKGDHGAFHKFVPGFTAPLHTHSANTRIVVISGTMSMISESGIEMKFPAGSFYTQPKTFKHTTKCSDASECLIYLEADAKWDIKPVGEK